MRIDLTVNGSARTIEAPPLRRLLDILREDFELTGTKEGCGEGECGACAVLLDGALVNSCLVPALQLDGVRVTTIEGLGTRERPDPIQTAFVEDGGVQCGFCTPGMVMAARALLDANPRPDRDEIRAGLAGNLCRCTGYERIVRAVERVTTPGERAGAEATLPDAGGPDRARAGSATAESGLSSRDLDETLRILAQRKGRVTVVAGATDLMTNVQLGAAATEELLDLSRVEGLSGIAKVDGFVEIGASTTLTEIALSPIVGRVLPALAQAATLFGAPAIRNRATIGGNVVTASPAADLPPALLALGGRVVLASATGRREMGIDEFYLGYRKTALRGDELLVAVRVPVAVDGTRQAFYKVGTRRAQAIAKVSIACSARVGADGVLSGVRIAAGSSAPTPILLPGVAAYLEGRALRPATIEEAAQRASAEVRPIADVRSTERYRRAVAGRLVARFLREVAL
jgi:carbon-monoxide dehydrogenase small subunit/xanthine dehydrogenase small subunit